MPLMLFSRNKQRRNNIIIGNETSSNKYSLYFITDGAVNLTFNTWKKQTKINKNNK